MQLGLFLMPAARPDRPLAETIDWNLDLIRTADRLGYAEAWVGQHLTSPWEPLSSPQQIIARAIGETNAIHLGTGVEVLYQSHPVRLAGELAQLDHMARGRLMFGFGSGGTPTDFQVYNVDAVNGQHQAMSREALEIILNCWQPGGPEPYQGRFWQVGEIRASENYRWHLSPFAPAEPRIAFAGFMPNSGSLTIAGERGYIPMSFNVAPEHVDVHWPVIEKAAQRGGQIAHRNKWRQIREIYVADSAREARNAVVHGFAGEFWNRYFGIIAQRLGIEDLFRRASAPANVPVDVEYLVDHGTWFVGDAGQVADQIVEQYRLTGGFGTLLQIGFDYAGSGEREGWMRSMELLATDVMPRVRARLGLSAADLPNSELA